MADLYQPFGAEGAVLLRAVADHRVDSVQRLRRRRARHGGAAARGDARVRRRARAADVGRVPLRPARRQGRVRPARRRSELHLRGRVPARRVLRPLLGRHDGQRLVSARTGRSLPLEWRASRQRPLEADADFDQLLLAGVVREDLGPSHGAHDVALRRHDQRHRPPTAGCSAWAGSSTSRASTAISSRVSTRRAWARATTGESAISRCFRRSPA